MKNCPKVIIVGAGVSGIAAASRLFEEGITNVLVLEAGNRIGGRIHTVDVPGESTVIEMGAQWVHGEKDNVVFELTSFRNLLRPSNASLLDAVFVQSSGHFIPQEISDKVLNILEDVRNEVTDVKNFKSSGDYFLEKINSALENSSLNLTEELKEQLIEWFHQDVNVFDGSDTWFKSSATILTDYWRCEGHQTISWKENGYRTMFSILTEKADAILGKSFIDNYVIKNTEVVKITPHKKGIRVKCDNGKEYEADHVIVTVSLGVLKATHSNLFPTKVLSHQKLKAIENLSMGTTAKLYLKFPYQWWSKDISELGLLWTKEDKEEYEKQGLKWITDIFSFMAVDNNPTMLCAWLAGQSAREMEKVYEPTVKRLLIHVLRKFLQKQYKIPEPNWFYRTNWKSNSLFRGTYSFKGIEADQMNVSATDLGEPIYNDDQVPVILFAGEATHAHYFGTVHGAIDTGFREANRIVSLRNSLE